MIPQREEYIVKDSQIRLSIIFVAVVLGCFTILKPVHIDEANFLMLTRGDFWAPHNTLVNWQGKTQKAFDVLSNPAGIAWYVWVLKHQDPLWMRLAMIPWTIVLLCGVERFGVFFGVQKWFLVLLTLFSPIVLLSHGAIMPDMPLFATYIAGLAGVCSHQRYRWAFLAGCAVWFRYSGLTVIPLILCWGILFGYGKKGLYLTAVACIPFILLTCHDVWAYGESHFLHMIRFQQDQGTPLLWKMISFFCMLSGAVVLPTIPKNRDQWIILMMSLGVGFGLYVKMNTVGDVFWLTFGLYLFLNTVHLSGKKEIALSIWILGGILFLSQLRFAATRYWLPFFLPVLIVLQMRQKFWEKIILLGTTAVLSIFLVIDDFFFSIAHKEAAEQAFLFSDKGLFAGHWGWQYYLEEKGWKSVEDDMALPSNIVFAEINTAWPQEVEGCRILKQEFSSSSFWGPRVHTYEGMANIHSSYLSGGWVVFSPWAFGADPYVQMKLFQTCP